MGHRTVVIRRLALLLVCAAPACSLNYAPAPLPEGFYGLEAATVAEEGERGWIGATVALNESDSLESLELQPGVRVQSLAENGPAARAGIRVGDVLLSFAGTPTDDPERLDALLRGMTEPQSVEARLQRGDEVLAADVEVELRDGSGLRSLYFVERARWRVALAEGGELPYPRVHQLADDSPLLDAGVREGDWILAFQGHDPGSPAELVRRVRRELGPGDPFTLRVRRDGGRERELEGRAWAPDRRLNALGLWPLFRWEVDRSDNRESFVAGDLILIHLFRVKRVGTVRRWAVLELLRWETGRPTLQVEGEAP